jgi:polynucleotide 5'-hydroxyl-kinase GRC3/NOL9
MGVSRLNRLPQRILCALPPACAVIVLRGLHTWVEGLGRVCKTFDGIFRPPKWQADDDPTTLGLSHAYYVGILHEILFLHEDLILLW